MVKDLFIYLLFFKRKTNEPKYSLKVPIVNNSSFFQIKFIIKEIFRQRSLPSILYINVIHFLK